VIFYSTKETREANDSSIPDAKLIVQLGGKPSGLSGRVKDFEILDLADIENWKHHFLLLTCGSDGAVRVWLLKTQSNANAKNQEANKSSELVYRLLDTYETGNRVTCMASFVMQRPHALDGIDGSDLESDDLEDEEAASSDESDEE
jgi:protein MAK11